MRKNNYVNLIFFSNNPKNCKDQLLLVFIILCWQKTIVIGLYLFSYTIKNIILELLKKRKKIIKNKNKRTSLNYINLLFFYFLILNKYFLIFKMLNLKYICFIHFKKNTYKIIIYQYFNYKEIYISQIFIIIFIFYNFNFVIIM